MRATIFPITMALFLVMPSADARWQKPYTMSGFPEINIAVTDTHKIENMITQGMANHGCSLVQQQGASLTYECSQERLDYKPRAVFNIISIPNGSRIVMREFRFTTKPDRPGTFGYEFSLDSTIETTQNKKTFMSDMAFLERLKQALEQIGTQQKYPTIGTQVVTVTPALRKQLRLSVNEGVFIPNVVPGSPADKSGVKAGDVIQAVNGTPVTQAEEVVSKVRASTGDSAVQLKVLRQKEQLEFTVKPKLPE